MRILLKLLIAGLLLVLVLALATEVVALHPSPTPSPTPIPAHRAHAVLVRKLPNSNEPPKTVQPVIR